VSGDGHIGGYRLNVHWLSRYRAADLSRRIGNAGGSPEIADWDDVTALAASGQRQLSAVTRPVKVEDLSRVKICDLFRRSAGQLLLPDIGDSGLHLEEIGFALKTTRSIGGNKAGRRAQMFAGFIGDGGCVRANGIHNFWDLIAAWNRQYLCCGGIVPSFPGMWTSKFSDRKRLKWASRLLTTH
jgi:hypothetical protein